jgi:hypothetical protein
MRVTQCLYREEEGEVGMSGEEYSDQYALWE